MTANSPDLAELMTLSGAGDHHAFNRLAMALQPLLMAEAVKLCGNEHDAKDCAQETLLILWRKSPAFASFAGGNVYCLAATIVRQRAMDSLRGRRVRASLIDRAGAAGIISEECPPEITAKHNAEHARHILRDAVAKLPVEYAAAIMAVYIEGDGVPIPDIAKARRINRHTLHTHLRTGKILLSRNPQLRRLA